MVAELDLSDLIKTANQIVGDALDEYRLRGEIPNMEQTVACFRKGLQMVFDRVEAPGTNIDDHVTLECEDISDAQDCSEVAIQMESKTELGKLITDLLSEGQADGIAFA